MDLVEEKRTKTYQVISVLILEESVWIKKVDHAIIHIMSIKKLRT